MSCFVNEFLLLLCLQEHYHYRENDTVLTFPARQFHLLLRR